MREQQVAGISKIRSIASLFPIHIILVLFFFSCATASASEQTELLKYEFTWNGSRAGHGDITTKADSGKLNVTAQAVSDGALKALVEIWSRIQATFSAKTLAPESYRFHLKSNWLRTEVVDLNFDHKNQTVRINKLKGEESESHSEKVVGIYDPISAVFLIRKQKDFSKPMYVDIFDGKDKARLYVNPNGQEQISIKSGAFDAIRLDLRLVKLTGDKKEIGTGKLWVTSDDRKIPLLLTSSPVVGPIRLELVHAQL